MDSPMVPDGKSLAPSFVVNVKYYGIRLHIWPRCHIQVLNKL